ncbi:MAG: DUF2378 family protein [Archangium sp.]|nr:DUF2378 family protein [Archangium sp.]MDP3153102.1 DUF2378 family protein [Archangium sp.]MDP3572235.1 DUF2378 family protein [Archangium sp.]
MSSEKVVFAQSMEGIYRALTPHTPQERAAFLKAGVKTGDHFDAAYPIQAWLDILDASAASRFAHLPELERYTEVGRVFFLGFGKTLMGSAVLGLLKVIGPRRTLDRLTRNFRSANNFTVGTFESFSANHHKVHINWTARPGFYLGLIESGCAHAGAKDLSVTVLETKDLGTFYEVKWA